MLGELQLGGPVRLLLPHALARADARADAIANARADARADARSDAASDAAPERVAPADASRSADVVALELVF